MRSKELKERGDNLPPFDLQRFAEGDGEDGEGGGKGDPQKTMVFVEKIDPVTKKSVRIPSELEPILGHFISSTRNEVEGRFKPMLEKLEGDTSELSQIKEEYEKLKQANMTAEERAQENARRVIDEEKKKAKTAIEERDTWKSRFEKGTIVNDIYKSFGNTQLCNPSQTAMIIENEGKARVEEVKTEEGKPTGEFVTIVTLTLQDKNGNPEQVEGPVSALFKRWIELERNAYHVVSQAVPGSGSKGSRMYGGGNVDYSKFSPVERLRIARERQKEK